MIDLAEQVEPPDRGGLVDLVIEAAQARAAAERTAAWRAAELFASFHTEFAQAGEGLDVDALWGQRRRRARDRDRAWIEALEATSTALTLALGWSWTRADALVELGLGLQAHPQLDAALAEGRCDERQAATILLKLRVLTDPLSAEQVLASVVTDPSSEGADAVLVRELRHGRRTLWQVPPHQLAKIVAREAARLEPSTLVDRQRETREERRVDYVSGEGFGPASLILTGPEPEVMAAYSHLDKQAYQAQQLGATLDQARFDFAIGGLTSGLLGLTPQGPGPGSALIQLITPVGGSAEPGYVLTPKGLVPLGSPELARQAAADDLRLQNVWVDSCSGTAGGQSRRYRPTGRLREFVAIRDGFASRYPSGNPVAEVDHAEAFNHRDPHAGGSTTAGNLTGQAKREHQAKTHGHFTISGDANGELTITDRTGHRYRSGPHQYLDPDRDPGSPSG